MFVCITVGLVIGMARGVVGVCAVALLLLVCCVTAYRKRQGESPDWCERYDEFLEGNATTHGAFLQFELDEWERYKITYNKTYNNATEDEKRSHSAGVTFDRTRWP